MISEAEPVKSEDARLSVPTPVFARNLAGSHKVTDELTNLMKRSGEAIRGDPNTLGEGSGNRGLAPWLVDTQSPVGTAVEEFMIQQAGLARAHGPKQACESRDLAARKLSERPCSSQIFPFRPHGI